MKNLRYELVSIIDLARKHYCDVVLRKTPKALVDIDRELEQKVRSGIISAVNLTKESRYAESNM